MESIKPGITLRDLVHAIPYQAIQEGLLTVEKAGKKNIFSGRILVCVCVCGCVYACACAYVRARARACVWTIQ